MKQIFRHEKFLSTQKTCHQELLKNSGQLQKQSVQKSREKKGDREYEWKFAKNKKIF